jgi:hypothetical protein
MKVHTDSLLDENALNLSVTFPEGTSADYMQDDIARGLCASLTKVLTSALANYSPPDFFKGVLSLARCQADLYGISWHDLVRSLCAKPELCGLIPQLQECSIKGTTPSTGCRLAS